MVGSCQCSVHEVFPWVIPDILIETRPKFHFVCRQNSNIAHLFHDFAAYNNKMVIVTLSYARGVFCVLSSTCVRGWAINRSHRVSLATINYKERGLLYTSRHFTLDFFVL